MILGILRFIKGIEQGDPLPQVIIFGRVIEMDSETGNYLMQFLLDASDNCYEYVDKHYYQIPSKELMDYRYLFRIAPEKRCVDRMIRKGYYKGNKSLGVLQDLERALKKTDGPYSQAAL